MNAQFNRRVLIDLFIWNDDQNSSRHIIYVRARGPGRRGSTGPGGPDVLRGPALIHACSTGTSANHLGFWDPGPDQE